MTGPTAELLFVIIGSRKSALPVLFRASLILKKTKLTCRKFTAPTSRHLCKPPVGNVGEIKRITRDESHLGHKNGPSTMLSGLKLKPLTTEVGADCIASTMRRQRWHQYQEGSS